MSVARSELQAGEQKFVDVRSSRLRIQRSVIERPQ